jgi:hypothetical protein
MYRAKRESQLSWVLSPQDALRKDHQAGVARTGTA